MLVSPWCRSGPHGQQSESIREAGPLASLAGQSPHSRATCLLARSGDKTLSHEQCPGAFSTVRRASVSLHNHRTPEQNHGEGVSLANSQTSLRKMTFFLSEK